MKDKGASLRDRAVAAEPQNVAQENLDLALANDPRTATPLAASEAYLELTQMYSHRGDGTPTQFTHGPKVAEAARVMWTALITALRSPAPQNRDGLAHDEIKAAYRAGAEDMLQTWREVCECAPLPQHADIGEGSATYWNDNIDRILAALGHPVAGRDAVPNARYLLDNLARAEANYRHAHDHFGPEDSRTGRAWDKMRFAGDTARSALNPTEAPQ